MTQEFTFSWQWDIKSSPEAIWQYAADINRFNRDTGQPEVKMLDNVKGTKHLRMKLPIIRVEWEEEPFEWTYPYSFGVVRRYSKGPCIVVNLNDRLDYFGSTVNIAARLPSFSQGGELIFSEAIHDDPEVQDFLAQNLKPDVLSRFTGDVKGFDEPFTMWRLKV